MTVLMLIYGLFIGAAQFFLLKNLFQYLLVKKKFAFLFSIAMKIMIYAICAVLLLTVIRDGTIPAGIGFGAGMTFSSFIYFACVSIRSRGSVNKGE